MFTPFELLIHIQYSAENVFDARRSSVYTSTSSFNTQTAQLNLMSLLEGNSTEFAQVILQFSRAYSRSGCQDRSL